ncbi:hypothetical protein CR513_50456, partial [Mucuna pruriens]
MKYSNAPTEYDLPRVSPASDIAAPRLLLLMFPISSRKLSPRATDDDRKIFARSDSDPPTADRQSGHVRFDRSHVSMHSAWKAWQQRGSRRRRSCCSNFDKHTAQSPPPPSAARRVTEENMNAGSVSTTEEESVSGDIRFPEENTAADDGDERRRKRLR